MEKKVYRYDTSWDDIRGVLGRYPLLFHYGDDQLCPVDEQGFRLINELSPLEFLAEGSYSDLTFVCIGGSTTFGWFVDQKSTYPSQLSFLFKGRVLNFGIPGLDIKNCLEILLQVLSKRTENLVVILLCGINEKMGFIQMNDSQIKEFKVTHSLFSRLDSGLRKKSFMAWSRATGSPKSLPEHRYKDFLNGQLTESNTYISLISQICTALNIKTYFLLQPHGLSFLQDSNSKLRERYLKDLYVGLATNKEVIDISNQCGMSADDFIDWQHPTTKGYEKIAKTIYKLLQYPNSGLFS